jgi:hypothetical protein
LLTFGQAGSFG